jgi:hypothetical protein
MLLEAIVIFGILGRSYFLVHFRGQYDKGGVLLFPIYFWYLLAFNVSVFGRSFALGLMDKDTKVGCN